jgi:hypothetical protein
MFQITVLPIVINFVRYTCSTFLFDPFFRSCQCFLCLQLLVPQITIECPQLCVDHVATLLYNNATLEQFNCCHGVSVLLHVIPRDQQVMVHLHDGH